MTRQSVVMTLKEFVGTFNKGTKIHQVFQILQDKKWHCRECEYTHTGITQIAGGSGIQGLQRGSGKRPGIVIKSSNRPCWRCNRSTRQDRWTGSFQESVLGPSMPSRFKNRVVALLGSRDVVEGSHRPANQLTVDHKLPMIRWTSAEGKAQTRYGQMSDEEIRAKFQLLKSSNGKVSHNLLKSRACEQCFKYGERGTPFGINFFYAGDAAWKPRNKKDPRGCIGCGWYDFDLWRMSLNETLRLALDSRIRRQS